MRNPIKAGILCAALLSFYASAWAALGEGEASVAVDQEAMNASRRVSDAPQYALHEIQLNSGTLVREYVSAKGIVFAVAWQGPFLPDLKQLLGQYFDAYAEAARNAPAGRGPIRIDGPELVVQSGGHMRAFAGRAYIPPEIPEGFPVDTIQ